MKATEINIHLVEVFWKIIFRLSNNWYVGSKNRMKAS